MLLVGGMEVGKEPCLEMQTVLRGLCLGLLTAVLELSGKQAEPWVFCPRFQMRVSLPCLQQCFCQRFCCILVEHVPMKLWR